MKTLLILSALLISSLPINAQSTNNTKIATCENSTYTPVILLRDGQIVKRELSKENFQKLDKVLVFSDCHNKYFDVKGFRMVGVKSNHDPIVIEVTGDKISQENKGALKNLKGNFRIFLEDIKIESPEKLDKSITFSTKVN